MDQSTAEAFWQAYLPSAFAEGRRFTPGLNRALHPEGLDADAVRRWLKRAIASFDITATEWARRAKLAPSTLNRFLKDQTAANLSATTISALAQVMSNWMEDGSVALRPRPPLDFSKIPEKFVANVDIIGRINTDPQIGSFEWAKEHDYTIKVPVPLDYLTYSFGIEIGSDVYEDLPLGSILVCDPAQRNPKALRQGQRVVFHRNLGDGMISTSLRRISADPDGQRWLTRVVADGDAKAFFLEDLMPAGFNEEAFVSFLVIATVAREGWVPAP